MDLKNSNRRINHNLMTTKEVAIYLRLDPQTILKWAKKGLISQIKVGHVIRYKRSEILKFIKNHYETL